MSRRDCPQCANGLVPCVCEDMPTRYEIRETQPGDFVPTMFVPMPQRGYFQSEDDDPGEPCKDWQTWLLLGALLVLSAPFWYGVGWCVAWVLSNFWELIK